jgi:hypothetical protein
MPLWKFRTFEEAEADRERYALEQLRRADAERDQRP